MVDQISGCSGTRPAADDGSSLGNGTVRTLPGPRTRPTRTCIRTPHCLSPTEHDTEACIRTCGKSILAKRLLVGGLLACHSAPAAQPSRVPYGYGEIIGKPFECRYGRWTPQVYLVAPALEFAKPTHGPQEPFSESQLCAYYRSIPDMQYPTPVYGSVPLRQRLQPMPPSTPNPRAAPSEVDATPDLRRPAVPHTARPEDAEILRQYHRIAHIAPSRRAMNSERGGGSTATARRILSHGLGGLSHNSGLCRGVYKHISRIAHPDKNLMRNAYYCAVAGIVMEAARHASVIVASSSSSDRDAFSLVPELDLA